MLLKAKIPYATLKLFIQLQKPHCELLPPWKCSTNVANQYIVLAQASGLNQTAV